MSETEQRLLDALDRVIESHGPSGVTLRKVGAEAGLSHTAAAHYYRDKPGLFTAYITRAYSRLATRIEQVATNESDWDALIGAGISYAEFALAEPSAFSVMTRLELTRVDTPELWAARERSFFALIAIIERAQHNGWASERTTLDLVATTWGLVHGVVDLWIGGPLWAPYDGHELPETLTRLLNDLLVAIDGTGAARIGGGPK